MGLAFGLILALLAMGTVAWLFLKDGPRPPSMMAQPEELPDAKGSKPSTAGAAAFEVHESDPASPFAGEAPAYFNLAGSGADRDPRFREFHVWGDAYVGDGEFGGAIAACRREFHPKLAVAEKCALGQRLLLQAEGETDAIVRAAEAIVEPEASETCRAWGECVAEAWAGRAAPALPTQGDSLELTTHSFVPSFASAAVAGADAEAYATLYTEALGRLESSLVEREAFLAEQIEQGTWTPERIESVRLEIARAHAKIYDYRRMAGMVDDAG